MTMGQVCCDGFMICAVTKNFSEQTQYHVRNDAVNAEQHHITSGKPRINFVSTIKKSVTVWISRLWNF